MLRYIGLRGVIRILKQSQHQSSSSPLPAASLNNTVSSAANDSTKDELENKNGDRGKKFASENVESKVKSKLVSTVFASLKNEEIDLTTGTKNELGTIISKAQSIDTLLSAISPKISRQNALKVILFTFSIYATNLLLKHQLTY